MQTVKHLHSNIGVWLTLMQTLSITLMLPLYVFAVHRRNVIFGLTQVINFDVYVKKCGDVGKLKMMMEMLVLMMTAGIITDDAINPVIH